MEGTRPATRDDLGALATLATEAVAALADLRGGEVWRRTASREGRVRESLAQDLVDEDSHVLLGTIDGTPVGYGVLRTTTLADGGRLGTVTDLYVEAGARGVGVGEAMMDALLARAREQGCFGVDSLALPGDRGTKNFFESFGLVARAITVHRSPP